MKKNIINKVLMIIFISFCIFSLSFSNVHASSEIKQAKSDSTSISGIFTKADEFINKGQSNKDGVISDTTVKSMSEILYNALLIIGIVIAVIIGMVIGIKLMTGSIEEKAKVKESLVAYIAGCIVIFGAFTIWRIIVIVLQSAPSA